VEYSASLGCLAVVTWTCFVKPVEREQLATIEKTQQKVPSIDYKNMISEVKETNTLLTNWSIAVFGATLYLLTIHKTAALPYYLIFLPGAWILLFHSLWYSWYLRSAITFQVFQKDYDFSQLNANFYLQFVFFVASLIPLAMTGILYVGSKLKWKGDHGRPSH